MAKASYPLSPKLELPSSSDLGARGRKSEIIAGQATLKSIIA